MSSPYIGEIRMFAGNFAPSGWMFCQGQTLAISDYDTLFALIGTTYGGDGSSTFRLPDLQSRMPVHQGTGSLGVPFSLGQEGGVEQVVLTTTQIPRHSHAVLAAPSATTSSAAGAFPAGWADSPYSSAAPTVALASEQLQAAGGSQPHENRQPYLVMNFIISLFGQFPTRS